MHTLTKVNLRFTLLYHNLLGSELSGHDHRANCFANCFVLLINLLSLHITASFFRLNVCESSVLNKIRQSSAPLVENIVL